MNLPQIAPDKLRPEILATVERLNGDDLNVLHRILLKLEKERLWQELTVELESDAQAGKYANLDALIRDARAEIAAR